VQDQPAARTASRGSVSYIYNAAGSPGGSLRFSLLHPAFLPPPPDHPRRGRTRWEARNACLPRASRGHRWRLGLVVRALAGGLASGLGAFDAVESTSYLGFDGQCRSWCAGRGRKWGVRWPPRVESKYDCRFIDGGNGVGSHSLAESGLSGYDSVMPRRPRIATGGYVSGAGRHAAARLLRDAHSGGSSRFRFSKTSTSSLWHRVNRSAQVGTPFGETVWQQATAKQSVWDWNPRYVRPAAQNASVPTGVRSHDAANRHQ
jgi:hypothetical protein